MSVRNLRSLFAPQRVALIGAIRDPDSVGGVVARNLIASGFDGPVMFVNPHADELYERPVYRNVAHLPETPELAVIATPPGAVPDIVCDLGGRGTKAVVVLTAGFAE